MILKEKPHLSKFPSVLLPQKNIEAQVSDRYDYLIEEACSEKNKEHGKSKRF